MYPWTTEVAVLDATPAMAEQLLATWFPPGYPQTVVDHLRDALIEAECGDIPLQACREMVALADHYGTAVLGLPLALLLAAREIAEAIEALARVDGKVDVVAEIDKALDFVDTLTQAFVRRHLKRVDTPDEEH